MDGIYNSQGRRFRTKKELRAAIGSTVEIEVTSVFATGGPNLPGRFYIVGPDPYHRRWYAKVEVDAGGILRKVDGRGAPKVHIPIAPVAEGGE